MRPVASVGPPAGNGTTNVIGRDVRQSRQRGSTRCQMQKFTARKFHNFAFQKEPAVPYRRSDLVPWPVADTTADDRGVRLPRCCGHDAYL
jgi:hypothetical protein